MFVRVYTYTSVYHIHFTCFRGRLHLHGMQLCQNLNGKNLCPLEQIFPLRVDHILKGGEFIGTKQEVRKIVFLLKMAKILENRCVLMERSIGKYVVLHKFFSYKGMDTP